MSIEVASEEVISLADAARELPRRRGGKRPHVSCLYRWTKTGCRGIVLESVQIGGTRCTSREALDRFFAALTAAAQGETAPPPPPPKSRRQAIEAAERRLARSGIGESERPAPAAHELRPGPEHTVTIVGIAKGPDKDQA